MATDLAIDLTHVAKIYKGKIHALQGIKMQVRRGEIFGLLGPNGAGKSTLVKIIMTVVKPTQAQGTVLGSAIGNKPTLAKVGYLPENHRFPRYLTARQTLEFFGAMCKVDRATAKRRAAELLDTVRMSNWADHKISTFSKGMMQRIGLAQSLMGDPDLVLLDEPTDGVDPVGRREILDAMGRLRDSGKTVFINSHALSELESICDRVAILVKGQVASQGTIDELTIARQRYEIEVVWTDPAAIRQKVLGGFPSANWKPAATSIPAAQMRQPPPVPGGPAPGGMPGATTGMPLNYARPSMTVASGPMSRTIDKGTLADGKWIEVDGPILRIGTTEAADIQPVIDALRSQGLIVRRVQPLRVSLEDLFIEAVTDPTTGESSGPGGRQGRSNRTGGEGKSNQFFALLVDGYRDLNARKLFWITLILSGIVIAAAFVFGINGTTITFAGSRFAKPPMNPLGWYAWGYSKVFTGIWLDWAAIALALISTAGIFPDLISSGSIDLYLSKPISRARLFIFKYLTGLLFVALQVAVFSFASFLLFGLRAHSWKPSLFLAIPIVVCMFSYLFGFCVLLGVWTRSTIAAILLTVLIWAGICGVQYADHQLLQVDVMFALQVDRGHQYLDSIEKQQASFTPEDRTKPAYMALEANRVSAVEQSADAEKLQSRFSAIHKVAHAIKTVVPKTGETNDLLDRWLLTDSDADDITAALSGHRQTRRHPNSGELPTGMEEDATQSAVESEEIQRHTSLWYVVGTSLLSEAIVVGLAAWIFCRRDY